MSDKNIKADIIKIISKYTSKDIIDTKSALTKSPYLLNPREIASIFMDIEKEFKIDLNLIIDDKFDFSIDSTVERIIGAA